MRWPPVVEAWMYRDPAEHADRLLARAARVHTPAQSAPAASPPRDRYYTRARQIHVKQLMKGKL